MLLIMVSEFYNLTLWKGNQTRNIKTASSKVVDYIKFGKDQPLNSSLYKVWFTYFQETFPNKFGFVYQTFYIEIEKDNKGYKASYTNLKNGFGGFVRVSQNGLKELSKLTKTQKVNNDLVDLLQEFNQLFNQ